MPENPPDRPKDEPVGAARLHAGAAVGGTLRPPSSKAQAQRVLLAALTAEGTTEVEGRLEGDDVEAALAACAACGARVSRAGARTRIAGVPGGPTPPAAGLEVGESATLARIATALLALPPRPVSGAPTELRARGSLHARSSPALFAALETAGVRLERKESGGWPVTVFPRPLPVGLELAHPGSSQEVSALLFALARGPGDGTLLVRGRIPSRPYVSLTRRVLADFGVGIEEEADGDVTRFRVRGPLRAPGAVVVLEPDASSAAVALAAACLSGGELLVPGLGPEALQGDVRVAGDLAAFGCAAEVTAEGLRAGGPPTRGACRDLVDAPDLAPVLAVVAAAAAERSGEASTLTGLAGLRGKESDRLRGLARGLHAAGFTAEVEGETLRIAPGTAPTDSTALLDPEGDHRMAFAFALLTLLRPGLCVGDPGCVAKSWPGFWDDLAALSAAP